MLDFANRLSESNRKRLVVSQVLVQEIMGLDDLPDAEVVFGIMTRFFNTSFDAMTKGQDVLRLLNLKTKKGMEYNLRDFLRINYEDMVEEVKS